MIHEDDVLSIAKALVAYRGFGWYDDPVEGGQDAYDICQQAVEEAWAAVSAVPLWARASNIMRALRTIKVGDTIVTLSGRELALRSVCTLDHDASGHTTLHVVPPEMVLSESAQVLEVTEELYAVMRQKAVRINLLVELGVI